MKVITVFLVYFYLTTLSLVYANELRWTEMEKHWLLALTSPDYRDDDFGMEIDDSDKILLERFKPRVFVSPTGLLPVDFYDFYLPNTVVRDYGSRGRVVMTSPTRDYLKGIERNKRYYLDYTGPLFPCKNDCSNYVASGYGRIYREKVRFSTGGVETIEMSFTILKYSFAFPYSGLPARLRFFREAIASIVADPLRWHELDIHGAVHIILDEHGRAIVLILAQHNHFRSYLIGKDVTWPENNHIPICFAERSNEPYPCHSGASPEFYRTVGNPKHIAYVINGGFPPLTAGEDKVFGINSGGKEVSYRLKFLPDRDPLYVSWIPLGDRKKFMYFETFYRNGPPGIDLNTWPELKMYGDIMQFWYVRDNNPDDASIMRGAFRSLTDVDFDTVLKHNGKRLYQDMQKMGYVDPP